MVPYYDDGTCVIYHGDCRELLPSVDFDVAVTDPPYGIAWKRGVNHARASKAHDGIQNDHDTTARDEALCVISPRPAVVFGSFYAPYPINTKQVLVWHKPPDSGLVGSVTGFRRDAEPIFLVGDWLTRTVERSSVLHSRCGQAGTVSETGHPHTKPLDLMTWLVDITQGCIVDPFMGSGTTLRAAKDLGRKAIGIEVEERYCEIAAKRLAQEVLDFGSSRTGNNQ
jgi:site-specific DNA-methyltransferase (adenine-specific)